MAASELEESEDDVRRDVDDFGCIFSSDEDEAVEQRLCGDSACAEASGASSASDLHPSPFNRAGGASTTARRRVKAAEETWAEAGAEKADLGEEFESLAVVHAALKAQNLGAQQMHAAVANQLFVSGGSVSSAGAVDASSGAPAGSAAPAPTAAPAPARTAAATNNPAQPAWLRRAMNIVDRRPRGIVHRLELSSAARRRRSTSAAAPGALSDKRARTFGFLNWYDSKQDYEVGLSTLHLGKQNKHRVWRGSRCTCGAGPSHARVGRRVRLSRALTRSSIRVPIGSSASCHVSFCQSTNQWMADERKKLQSDSSCASRAGKGGESERALLSAWEAGACRCDPPAFPTTY